jgi:hypothetical protein
LTLCGVAIDPLPYNTRRHRYAFWPVSSAVVWYCMVHLLTLPSFHIQMLLCAHHQFPLLLFIQIFTTYTEMKFGKKW